MTEPRNVRNMLAEAERAASVGDLGSAEELLRDAARLQETELGPLHPDLANTLNNLAVITEKEGRTNEAETSYRRAVEIVTASLPPDDPMVVESRRNLEEFCRAHGLPIEKPAVLEHWSPVSRKAWAGLAVIATGIVVLLVAAFMIARPRSSRQESKTIAAAEPAPRRASQPVRPTPATPALNGGTASPAPALDSATEPGAIALAAVQLCQSFSARDWQCVAAGDSVAPGTIALYTRVRSPHDGVIVHRWYQGDALRRTTQLRIRANAAEGYRTYSRQAVDPGDWRVEVRNANGELLHEQRFAVRE